MQWNKLLRNLNYDYVKYSQVFYLQIPSRSKEELKSLPDDSNDVFKRSMLHQYIGRPERI